MERAQGFAEQGNRHVWTAGRASFNVFQESAPFATIFVFHTGTGTLAPIYSDNQVPPTPQGNPFTANTNGYWFFYAEDGRYDVLIEGPYWTWTIGDILLQDPGRWSADQNANGHWLNDLGGISFINGPCRDSIFLDSSCNLLFTGTGGNTLMSLSPQGDLTIAGNLKVGGGFELDGPWLSDQNANGHSLTGLSTLQMSNGICSTKIAFDANCYLVVYGSLGVTENLDVNGLTNLAGKLKVDGGFELDGPWLTDQNANGHSLTGLDILGVSTLHLSDGACKAELGFDVNCNVVLTGNLKVSGSLDVGGGITGGPPTYPGVTSQDALVQAGSGTARAFGVDYQNLGPTPLFVVVCVNLGPHDGAVAFCDVNTPPGLAVASVLSESEDFTLIMPVTFWVLPGYFYRVDSIILPASQWPPIINTWVEWH